jgi:hypothetical protein
VCGRAGLTSWAVACRLRTALCILGAARLNSCSLTELPIGLDPAGFAARLAARPCPPQGGLDGDALLRLRPCVFSASSSLCLFGSVARRVGAPSAGGVVMVPGRRRGRAAQTPHAATSLSAGDQAVHAAEEIVARAWAERLLRYCDRVDRALGAAREQYEVASVRLAAAQRRGDLSEISVAHAMLQHASDACRSGEASREQGRRALQKAIDALAGAEESQRGRDENGARGERRSVPAPAPAVTPGPSTPQVPPCGSAHRTARRALWWFGPRRPRRAPDSGRP